MKNLCKPLILFLTLIFLISCSTLVLATSAGLGDLDGDSDIDTADYLIFRSSLGTRSGDPGYNPDADFDGDGCISYADLSLSTSASAVPSVELVELTIDIFVGDTFDVDVVANGVDVLAFDLDYNTTAFAFNGATIGSLFYDDSSIFDTIDVAGSVFPPGVSGGDIMLASLSFVPLTDGIFSLGITSSSSDLNEGLTTLFWSEIDITQNLDIEVSRAPVPEPSTMILMCLGLVGMVGYRNKFKK